MNAPLPPGSLDLLNRLRDIHEPPPPGTWPPAPGWWLLLFALLGGAAAAWLWFNRRERRIRRAALAELARLRAASADDRALLTNLNQLLRRFARALDPQPRPDTLAPSDWAAYLARTGAGAPLEPLATAPYRPEPDVDLEALLEAAETYVRTRPC